MSQLNNQNEGYEGRILVAFALTFIIIFAWTAYMRSIAPPEPPPGTPTETPADRAENTPDAAADSAAPGTTRTPRENVPATPQIAAPATPALSTLSRSIAVKQGAAEEFITVESDKATVTFSTLGAVAHSWTLAEHRDAKGDPLELVHSADTGLGFPLQLELDDADLQSRLDAAIFAVSTGGGYSVLGGTVRAPAELIFEWSDGDLAARKRVAFLDGYVVNLETEVSRGGVPLPHRVRWGGGFGELHRGAAGFVPSLLLRKPDGLQRVGIVPATETTGWIWKAGPQLTSYTGPAAYAGLEDRYFAVLMIPETPALDVTVTAGEWVPTGHVDESNNANEADGTADDSETKPAAQKIGSIAVGMVGATVNKFRLFVGPKDFDDLGAVDILPLVPEQPIVLADELIDFGWFWWVAKPLLIAMQWIHANIVGNYGWAIILLTLLINVIMFPLKYKSSQQAWRMQKVQPQVKVLQEKAKKYKASDPRKQESQQEIMALYRREGVNPLGGCLPLLIQMPFFLGFYRLLYSVIELRMAPWMLWVTDLSQPDPYYLLPIVMTGTMYLSTIMTPMTTADPGQQRMMRMMPLLFGFMFLTFPAGLVLYWFTSNVVGVGQQWWINKRHREFLAAEKVSAKEAKKQRKKDRQQGN